MPPRKRPPESPPENSAASERVANAKEAMDKFKTLARGLVEVPRADLEAEERRYQKRRAKGRQ